MARNSHIKYDEFCNLWANNVGRAISPDTMKKYLVGLENTILEQLKLNDEVYIHNFGTFSLRKYGGEIRTMGDMRTKGKTIERFIAPKITLDFRPANAILEAINENNFEFKKKKRPKKYATKKEQREVYNAKRRKPKKSLEEVFCDMTNHIDERREEEE